MSRSANVKSVAAIAEFKGALARFRNEMLNALRDIGHEIQNTMAWLEERKAHWQRHVEECRNEVLDAQRALADCKNSGYYDDDGDYVEPDCSAYEDRLDRAYRELRKAEEELANVYAWIKRVGEEAEGYRREASRLHTMLQHSVPGAEVRLGTILDELNAYLKVTTASGIQTPTVSGGSPNSGSWTERGIVNVPVDQIDLSQSSVAGDSDFIKVSRKQMEDGFKKLGEVVLSAVANGADKEFFRQMDNEKGLDYSSGYQRVYEAFFGNEPVRLVKDGDSYQVVNGFHRLFVARELGVGSIPASVSEKVEK